MEVFKDDAIRLCRQESAVERSQKTRAGKLAGSFESPGVYDRLDRRYTDIPFLTSAFNASDFDIIAFGRGVSPENKQRLKQTYKEQNPKIQFVDGLAPITNLLVDQIKWACVPDHESSIKAKVTFDGANGIRVETRTSCRLTVKHYTLNWLFQSKERVVADQQIDGGTYRFSLKPSRGRNFLVIMQDGMVSEIRALQGGVWTRTADRVGTEIGKSRREEI